MPVHFVDASGPCAWIVSQFLGRPLDVAGSVRVFVDAVPTGPQPAHERWVFLQVEAPVVSAVVQRLNVELFDLILTYHVPLLAHKHARLFLPFRTYYWVRPPMGSVHPNLFLPLLPPATYDRKTFQVTMLCGHKLFCPGHVFRRRVWEQQEQLRIPRAFYYGRQPGTLPRLPGTRPAPAAHDKTFLLADAMFHIAIENAALPHYFTEKLVDCLASKTIPIYYGCTNLGDYLDLDGIIVVRTPAELVERVNALTPEYYAAHAAAVQRNYETWQAAPSFHAQLTAALAA
jgi:hypothetical protein